MDSKQKYLDKIRGMGILKEKNMMPKVSKESKVFGGGFSPIGTEYSSYLLDKKSRKSTPERDIQEAIGSKIYKKNTPETQNAAEDVVEGEIELMPKEEDRKSYMEVLKRRMRTA